MARPITAGITAWQLIQTMPKHMPPTSVCHCPRAIHQRNAPGELCAARPGMVEREAAHSLKATERAFRERMVIALAAR